VTEPDPGDRGALDIDPQVLRKVVEYAADQVPGTMRHGRRVAGIDVGETGARARIVAGNGDPAAVDVRLEVTLRYPAEIRAVVDAVRRKVDDELVRINGHHIRTLAVTVAGLRGAARPTPARLL
jgi:uncharacterized alkaline shock family protein YloU